MPHLNPLITPSTEMGHREPMTINAFASSCSFVYMAIRPFESVVIAHQTSLITIFHKNKRFSWAKKRRMIQFLRRRTRRRRRRRRTEEDGHTDNHPLAPSVCRKISAPRLASLGASRNYSSIVLCAVSRTNRAVKQCSCCSCEPDQAQPD